MKALILSLLSVLTFIQVLNSEEPNFFNVRDFGALGDGAADDTAAIQRAIDSVYESGGGTLHFPAGTYLVTSVGIRSGIRYLGYAATIKRPPKQGKWVRTFDAAKEGYYWNDTEDSPWLTIEGLTFDGNRLEQGGYEKYQLEQAHLVFLGAQKASRGRLRARVINCDFRECVADGISIHTNVDAQISNCSAINCFRGGFTLTGGGTRLQVSNFTAGGDVHPSGIDVEVDGAGADGTRRVELQMTNVSLPDGDFDVGVHDDSVVFGSNINARAPFNLYARESTIKIVNSRFGVGYLSGKANRIVYPHNVVFSNCLFEVDGQSGADDSPRKWSPIHIYWNLGKSDQTRQLLKLVDCEFRIRQQLQEGAESYAVFSQGDHAGRQNRLVLDGCQIAPEFDWGVWIDLGGTVRLEDVDFESENALHAKSTAAYPLDLEIDGGRFLGARFAKIPQFSEDSRLHFQDVVIDHDNNVLDFDAFDERQYRGRRVILWDDNPTSQTHGFVGDLLRYTNPEGGGKFEWICTRSGDGDSAEWKLLNVIEPQ